jgi:hypothetical protein
MTLSKTYEKLVNGYNQIMTVVVDCKHPDDFGYDDVKVYVSHMGRTMEISWMLDKAELLTELVDNIDWYELAQKEEIIIEND